jgi:hypothetical protein
MERVEVDAEHIKCSDCLSVKILVGGFPHFDVRNQFGAKLFDPEWIALAW